MELVIATLCGLLVFQQVLHHLERKRAAEERSGLLNRIQAPELVLHEERQKSAPDLKLVPFDPGVPYDGSMSDPVA